MHVLAKMRSAAPQYVYTDVFCASILTSCPSKMYSPALDACITQGGVCNIRITPNGKSVSLIDVIRIVCFTRQDGSGFLPSARTSAQEYTNRLPGWAPDGKYKFKGRGQQYTPIVSLERLPALIRILICKMRRSMKWKRETLMLYGCCTEELDVDARFYVEAEVLPHLTRAFAACGPTPQMRIGPYRIDLYLLGPKIAVECDENGHSGYNKNQEAGRESFIQQALGCSFVRFNPQAQGFDLMDTVAAIVDKMVIKHPFDHSPTTESSKCLCP